MKVNNDKHEVHLSREMYDALLAWATVGVQESYSSEYDELTPLQKIKWHARKFNTQLHIERDQELAKEERETRKNKRELFRFLKENTGKQAWWFHDRPREGGEYALLPIRIIGRSRKDKTKVLVEKLPYSTVTTAGEKMELPIWKIIVDLPDGAVTWNEGPWAGTARVKKRLIEEG